MGEFGEGPDFGRQIDNRWNSVLSGCARRPDLFEIRRGERNIRLFILRECLVDGEIRFPKDIGINVEASSE